MDATMHHRGGLRLEAVVRLQEGTTGVVQVIPGGHVRADGTFHNAETMIVVFGS